MPKYFLTKVWGFSPDDYPVLGFPQSGGLEKFLRESTSGDWMIVAGTKGQETATGERGRLLGMMRLGRKVVDVVAVLESLGTPIPPEHRLGDGQYRWPRGLPMIEARRFAGQPDVAEIFGDYLPGQEWAAFAIDLSGRFPPAVIKRVAELPTEPLNIARSPIIAAQVAVHDALGLHRLGPTGPGPSDHRAAVERTSTWGFAYALKLVGPSAWRPTFPVFKVGRSIDVAKRAEELNSGLLPFVTGFRWQVVMQQRFRDEAEAHAFEQAVHERLRNKLVRDEREVYQLRQGDLEAAWMTVFQSGEWSVALPG